ncbi:MAG: hypothetical protein P3A28_10125 [Gemmatimonadota bacterium]|nr:hypothetical protein [Gemmatimonadota bacterium]
MRLSTEGRRARWVIMAVVWVMVAILALRDSSATRDYVAMLDASGTRQTDSLPLVRPAPAGRADATVWARLAIESANNGSARLRRTEMDNAPTGRDVHWNSALIQLVALSGRWEAWRTGVSLARGTESSLAWINLPLLFIAVGLLSGWAAGRAGAASGAIVALGLIGHPLLYNAFAPNNVDHHGLLAAAALGLVLGATFMGAGWHTAAQGPGGLLPVGRAEARRASAVSAACGGIGMWVSAASTIPVIALVGAAGLASAWIGSRAQGTADRVGGVEFDPEVWRRWGWIGGAVSLAAYLLEYAPALPTLRLEVNHPLFAAAWVAGGELIAMVAAWRVYRRRISKWRFYTWAAVALMPGLLVISLGSQVFALADPGLFQIHSQIQEFLSVPRVAKVFGWSSLTHYAAGAVLLLPLASVVRAKRQELPLAGFISIVTLGTAGLAFWQVRWWSTASGPQVVLLLMATAILTSGRRARAVWSAVVLLGLLAVAALANRTAQTSRNVRNGAVTLGDALQPMYRDIASVVRASQGDDPVVLLSTPSASLAVSYFGQFASLGTLYWENLAGLRSAASILSAPTDDEARQRMMDRGITHLVLVSADDFLRAYENLAGVPAPAIGESTFGRRILHDGRNPRWLRVLPFRPRAGPPLDGIVVRVLQVVPDMPDDIWLSNRADGAVANRDWRGASALLAEAISHKATPELELKQAWLMATAPSDEVRNGALALSVAVRFMRRAPGDPTVLDVYAAALAEVGRFADAAEAAGRAVAILQSANAPDVAARVTPRLDAYRGGRPWRQ